MQRAGVDVVENVHSQLLDIFVEMNADEAGRTVQDSAKKKLAARRAIEQHFEMKALQRAIGECWFED